MIHPTIGRKVWYQPSDYDRGIARTEGDNSSVIQAGDRSQPWDATIVCVHGDRCVNLLVVDHNGYTHQRWSVPLLQDDDPVPAAGAYAEWMPYQVGQAKAQQA